MSCATHGEHDRDVRLGRMLRNLSWPRHPSSEDKRRMRFEDYQSEASLMRSKRASSHGELDSLWKKPGAQWHLTPSARCEKCSVSKIKTVVFVLGLVVLGMMGFDPLGLQTQGSGSAQIASQGLSLEGARHGAFQGLRRIRSTRKSQVLGVDDHREREGVSASENDGLVEVLLPGLFVPVRVALNLSLWNPLGVLYNDKDHPLGPYARKTFKSSLHNTPDQMHKDEKGNLDEVLIAQGLKLDIPRAQHNCPSGDLRILVAVIASCCTAKGAAKRSEVRKTWMKISNEEYRDKIDARFFIAQPKSEEEYLPAVLQVKQEVSTFQDIVVMPGPDSYLELPRKVLQIMKYAAESPCHYTHVLKIDDDCYLRSDNLIEFVKNDTLSRIPTGKGGYDSGWTEGLYAGRVQGRGNEGFWPVRDEKSKWYLADEELPEEIAPLGIKYNLGWGYLLSRDLVRKVAAWIEDCTQHPKRRPAWWGILPWEDTVIGAILEGSVTLSNTSVFRAAWHDCPPNTVVKHLDIDALDCQRRLYEAQVSGEWKKGSIHCTNGPYPPNYEEEWRVWRNSLPDVKLSGEE